jgi:hypothetical protein
MAEGSLSAAPAIRLGRKDLKTNRKDNFFLLLFFDGGLNLSDLSTIISIIIQSVYSLSNLKNIVSIDTVFMCILKPPLYFCNL